MVGRMRTATTTIIATLGTYASALALERAAHLRPAIIVLAVVLAVTVGRRRADGGILLLPVVAIAASEVGVLALHHRDLAEALFVVALSGSIWVRRFGLWAARAGTFVALPFVALLVAPVPPAAGGVQALWAAVAAAIAVAWSLAVRRLAGVVPEAAPPRRPRARISTRMAAQMGVALTAAFVLGQLAFGVHQPWVVITAFIVCSGNRGRGDVLRKSVLRLGGAAAGTVGATVIASPFAPGAPASVAAIFAVLAVGTVLRERSYAYWAGCVTAVLALLYGYFGEGGAGMLPERLAAIATGAAIGIAASWLVLPVRTREAVRARAGLRHEVRLALSRSGP
jgi:hypothetical protein